MTDQLDAPVPVTGPGFVLHFRDNREPAIDAGLYRVRTEQTLPDVDAGDYLVPVEETFEVRAPQFALADDQVHAVNPAPGTHADHSTTLAHLTLANPLLPWMRRLDEPGRADAAPAEPWLALLVFAEGELPADPRADAVTVTRTAEELLTDAEGVRHPRIAPSQIEGDPTAPCRTVDIPGDVFATVVPRTEELRHLLHVRDVTTDTGLRGEQLAEGTYAVVVSSRLPDRTVQARYAAHLVALEGCRSILADADAGRLTHEVTVRLAALHSWSFTSDPAPGGGFAGRVRHFLFDSTGQERDLLLRLPPPPAGDGSEARASALARLESGRVPLPYRLETGEDTYAWYRGPFTAEPAQKLPDTPEPGWTSAAQLMVYERAWGLFDAGWGAAWTLGRALALADADFAATLSAWHAKARARAAAMAQRLTAPGLGTQASSRDAAAFHTRAMGPRPFGGLLEELAADGTAARVLRAATHPAVARPVPPPPDPARHAPAAGHRGAGRAARTAALLADPPTALRTALAAHLADDAEPVTAWLRKLRLLHHIPFPALVPDESALPAESLRVFYVDPGWLTALASGAAGIAITGELDAAVARIAAPWARGDEAVTPRAGVLIRSALVREYPGLLVRPYQGHGDTRKPIAVLRQDTLGPDVLLVLFAHVPDEIELAEPPEGLSFGIDTDLEGRRTINLRRVDVPVAQEITNEAFPNPPGPDGLDAHLRPDPAGRPAVLDLRPTADTGLLRALGARLTALGQQSAADFGPAGLATQLVNAPLRQLITREPAR